MLWDSNENRWSDIRPNLTFLNVTSNGRSWLHIQKIMNGATDGCISPSKTSDHFKYWLTTDCRSRRSFEYRRGKRPTLCVDQWGRVQGILHLHAWYSPQRMHLVRKKEKVSEFLYSLGKERKVKKRQRLGIRRKRVKERTWRKRLRNKWSVIPAFVSQMDLAIFPRSYLFFFGERLFLSSIGRKTRWENQKRL